MVPRPRNADDTLSSTSVRAPSTASQARPFLVTDWVECSWSRRCGSGRAAPVGRRGCSCTAACCVAGTDHLQTLAGAWPGDCRRSGSGVGRLGSWPRPRNGSVLWRRWASAADESNGRSTSPTPLRSPHRLKAGFRVPVSTCRISSREDATRWALPRTAGSWHHRWPQGPRRTRAVRSPAARPAVMS